MRLSSLLQAPASSFSLTLFILVQISITSSAAPIPIPLPDGATTAVAASALGLVVIGTGAAVINQGNKNTAEIIADNKKTRTTVEHQAGLTREALNSQAAGTRRVVEHTGRKVESEVNEVVIDQGKYTRAVVRGTHASIMKKLDNLPSHWKEGRDAPKTPVGLDKSPATPSGLDAAADVKPPPVEGA